MNTPRVERKQVSFWNDENKETARRMYLDEDKSSSIVGAYLGVTRNSVIGIINRMGLKKDKKVVVKGPKRERKKYVRARTAADRVERRAEGPAPVLIHGEAIPPLLNSVLDLTYWSCNYPYGAHSFQFCGRPKVRGAFCRQHATICYQDPLYRRVS
jgi:hypothetical protein